MTRIIFLLVVLLALSLPARAQSYGERLGWNTDEIVLILHVDDVGMSHSSNLGVIESMEKGVANSFSIMMPCPWVPEIVQYIRQNPDVDAGLHLTLTSEWKLYRWGPVAGKAQVPGLVDQEGCLWHSVEQVAANASADEVETEIRAQIDRAERMGIKFTHLDSHMGTLFARLDYFDRFVKIGIEKQVPILAAGGHLTHAARKHPQATLLLRPYAKKIWDAGLPVIDDLHTDVTGFGTTEKKARFLALVDELKPGITEILFHASVPTEEFPLITGSSAARHYDTKLLTDPEVLAAFEKRAVKFTTWRELHQRRRQIADNALGN